MPQFQIRECTRPDCHFRFPVVIDANPKAYARLDCLKCGSDTRAATALFANDKESGALPAAKGAIVEALLDNIRSTFNVGAMFRTADGAGLSHLHLAGITPTPANPKISKTALGAENSVPWSYHRNALDAALELKNQGMHLWALESTLHAQSLFSVGNELPGHSILLVVGNELSGVDPAILAECEKVVAIPMAGQKNSLNVAIAFGIAAYYLRYGVI